MEIEFKHRTPVMTATWWQASVNQNSMLAEVRCWLAPTVAPITASLAPLGVVRYMAVELTPQLK